MRDTVVTVRCVCAVRVVVTVRVDKKQQSDLHVRVNERLGLSTRTLTTPLTFAIPLDLKSETHTPQPADDLRARRAGPS